MSLLDRQTRTLAQSQADLDAYRKRHAMVECPDCHGRLGGYEEVSLDPSRRKEYRACETCNDMGAVKADPWAEHTTEVA